MNKPLCKGEAHAIEDRYDRQVPHEYKHWVKRRANVARRRWLQRQLRKAGF